MNYLRTAILLAGLTALFMGIGYLIGGEGGAVIALFVAAGMNLVTYWNADRIVLSMHDAHEVDEATAPDLVRLVRDLARQAGLPMPRVYLMDNPQPNAFATGRNPEHAAVAVTHRPAADAVARGNCRRARARARPHQEPRHADHDDHRDHRGRDLDAGAVRDVLRRRIATTTAVSA